MFMGCAKLARRQNAETGTVPRIKLLGVRFSAGEFVRIVESADALGMTPTACVRHQALRAIDGAPTPPARFQPPPHANPPARLTHTAGTRFSEAQFEALSAHARACGLTVTAFIRKLVLGVKPIARMPAIQSAIVAVNRVGTNLNLLVKLRDAFACRHSERPLPEISHAHMSTSLLLPRTCLC